MESISNQIKKDYETSVSNYGRASLEKEARILCHDNKERNFSIEITNHRDGGKIFELGSWGANFWFTLGAKDFRGFATSLTQWCRNHGAEFLGLTDK